MHTQPYVYDRRHLTSYTFVSKGRRGAITKVVEFTPTAVKNIINLGFGDLRPDGSIDDTANSNNDDIIKVLATVILIIKDFTNEHPNAKIVFAGSTSRRTELYHRILKTYYSTFAKDFVITALQQNKNGYYSEVVFETEANNKYVAFFVKRK